MTLSPSDGYHVGPLSFNHPWPSQTHLTAFSLLDWTIHSFLRVGVALTASPARQCQAQAQAQAQAHF